MKMPPPIATKFTKLVLTILAITILGIILSFISQDHTLLMLSAGVAVAGIVTLLPSTSVFFFVRLRLDDFVPCVVRRLEYFKP